MDLLRRKKNGNIDKIKNKFLRITEKISKSFFVALAAYFAAE